MLCIKTFASKISCCGHPQYELHIDTPTSYILQYYVFKIFDLYAHLIMPWQRRSQKIIALYIYHGIWNTAYRQSWRHTRRYYIDLIPHAQNTSFPSFLSILWQWFWPFQIFQWNKKTDPKFRLACPDWVQFSSISLSSPLSLSQFDSVTWALFCGPKKAPLSPRGGGGLKVGHA